MEPVADMAKHKSNQFSEYHAPVLTVARFGVKGLFPTRTTASILEGVGESSHSCIKSINLEFEGNERRYLMDLPNLLEAEQHL